MKSFHFIPHQCDHPNERFSIPSGNNAQANYGSCGATYQMNRFSEFQSFDVHRRHALLRHRDNAISNMDVLAPRRSRVRQNAFYQQVSSFHA